MRVSVITLVLVGSAIPFALTPKRTVTAHEAEVARIKGHFDSVLVELRSRDVAALSASQREHRALVIATLAAYRDRGLFPKNYDFPGHAVPYFVDRKTGVLCAVAHLLESTGRRDIVDRVAAADNNVWVPALAGDSAFVHWLDTRGLTIAEAARIQVPYVSPVPAPFMMASAATALVSTTTAIWNATANRDGKIRFMGILGVATGATSLALAIGGSTNSDVPGMLNAVSFGAGGASLLASSESLFKRKRLAAAGRDAERKAQERGGIRADIAPTFSMAGQKAASVAVHVTF